MVEEVIQWCRPCEQFHQESNCYVANQVMEHGIPDISGQETTSSEPDHVYMVGQAYPLSPAKQYKPKDETIAESYSETYDENCNAHDGTPTFSPYNDDTMEGYCLVTFSLKNMSMKMRTSITWSMIQVTKTPLSNKDVEEESWTFMENPVYKENNEP